MGYGDVVYRRIRANSCPRFLHANSWMWKCSEPDCAPQLRGGYQPFEISVARAGGGVNGTEWFLWPYCPVPVSGISCGLPGASWLTVNSPTRTGSHRLLNQLRMGTGCANPCSRRRTALLVRGRVLSSRHGRNQSGLRWADADASMLDSLDWSAREGNSSGEDSRRPGNHSCLEQSGIPNGTPGGLLHPSVGFG